VLHPIAGRPMLHYPLAAAEALRPQRLIVVVGRDAEQVEKAVGDRAELVLQSQQRGTGHAVLQTARALEGFRGDVLILYGDTPLLRAETLERMLRREAEARADLVVLTAKVEVPGIVVRNAAGRVARIVEATDASPPSSRSPSATRGSTCWAPSCSGSCWPRWATRTARARST
jgi:bifunctional UDP-N-acetylglucosamine pyrophosphorylase/glucosamine-1-phosphate N-acetyltransferase